MKVSPNISTHQNRMRRINEMNQGRGNPGGGRFGRGRGRGYSRGGRFNGRGCGRGRGQGQHNQNDSRKPYYINGQSQSYNTWMTTTRDGKQIECHPRASYPPNIWYFIPKADNEKIHNIRKNNNNSSDHYVVSEVTQHTGYMSNPSSYHHNQASNMTHNTMHIQQAQSHPPLPQLPPTAPPHNPNQVSVMGGRNEQASLRSHHSNN